MTRIFFFQDSAKLHNADLRNVNFLGANLTNCRLPGADLRGILADWVKKNFFLQR